MDCVRFQELINDFIYDKIRYSDELQEFIEHMKTCADCKEELHLYYMIHRGLGDVPAPVSGEENSDITQEMEDIINFYEDYFNRRNQMKKAGRISVATFLIVAICAAICIYLRMIEII